MIIWTVVSVALVLTTMLAFTVGVSVDTIYLGTLLKAILVVLALRNR